MKVLLVYKKSAWELFSSSEDPHVSAFMSESNRDAQFFEESHETQVRTLETVRETLESSGAEVRSLYRSDLVEGIADGIDLAVTVGGDGTFLETSHYITDLPMLGVNSDPKRSVGFFCACTGPGFPSLYEGFAELPRTSLARAEIAIDGGVVGPPVLNDVLFANPNPAATTRYRIGDRRYRNSGLLACTSAGSTAWMFQEGGEPMPLDDRRLQLFHRGTRGCRPRFAESLELLSLTRRGRIFIDGEHLSFPLALGQKLELRCGTPLQVVGDLSKKREEFLARYETN